MPIPSNDAEKMKNLVREGKPISKIVGEDFPQYDYLDVYSEVYGSEEQSAQGVKRMIAIRLNKLAKSRIEERRAIVVELNDLIWYLYNNYKSNRDKLGQIREILG